ncbi:MAG TPA: hypothetical protein ENK32_07600 [Anaerolineae bacterium]|nr:hypothetical protein [Anaerolineae bacterium]
MPASTCRGVGRLVNLPLMADKSKNRIARAGHAIRNTQYATLLLIILLGFGLRLANAEAFSFWTDEGLTPLRSGYTVGEILSNRIVIQDGVTKDTHPPLFYLLIHFSRRLFGETDFAFRYPSLLAGILAIPLAYQLGRRLDRRNLGLLFALLTAVNPLQIWYANETRQYTLLVLLTMGATYVLWRAMQVEIEEQAQAKFSNFSSLTIPQYLVLYILLAGLALYTHYSTFFLIAGQGLFWLWLLWRKGYRKLLAGTAVAVILLAIPLIPFTVPRFFKGYEANFYYVQPQIMLQDVYRFFALGRSVDYLSPLITWLTLAGLGLALLGLYAAKPNLRRLFLLVYLLSVVFGLMAGSLVKPMYQGARHIMIGSPAFLLLMAWGVIYAARRAFPSPSPHSLTPLPPRRIVWGLIFILGLLTAVAGPIISLNNYFAREQFIKDDYRAMIRFIEANAGENDVIVYNNAILLPLHQHYQTRADIALTASPVYPYAASDVSIPQLEELAQTYDRIWFVTEPPADKRDKTGLVENWLDEHLTRVGEYTFPSATSIVRTQVYETGPQTAAALPENGRPLNITWPNLPPLTGVVLNFTQPVTQPALWFDLFWENQPIPDKNMALRFNLRGADGRAWWAQQESPLHNGWPEGEGLVRQSYRLPLPPGTPPGRYPLLAQPFTAGSDDALGDPQPLVEVELAGDFRDVPGWPTAVFQNGVVLRQIEMPDTAVRPGHNLPLTLFWQIAGDHQNLRYELEVVGPDGAVLRRQSDPPGAQWLAEWPDGLYLAERAGLYFPPETEPGTYRLRWRLLEDGETVRGRPFWRPWLSEKVTAGSVTVQPWPLETSLPDGVTLLEDARFGDAIELAGFDLARPSTDTLALTLYWRATAAPEQNYFSFVHLVNEDGEIVTPKGFVPAEGLRPTKGWRAGEVIADPYTLELPPDLPPGTYELRAGLYQPDDGVRPLVTLQGQPQPDNQLLLSKLFLP